MAKPRPRKLGELFDDVWEARYIQKLKMDEHLYNILKEAWIWGYRACESGEHLHPAEKRMLDGAGAEKDKGSRRSR